MPNQPVWGNIIVGSSFGSWDVLEISHSSTHLVLCRCSCGTEKRVQSWSLKNGRSKSCQICAVKSTVTTHGATVNRKESRLYKLWKAMKWRCNPRNPASRSYHERGIFVCEQWKNDFAAFQEWSLSNGYADNLTLDRIDNDREYSPDNCRWTTMITQANNRQNTILLTILGETKPRAKWARDDRCQVSYSTFRRRLDLGWPPAKALLLPSEKGKPLRTRCLASASVEST